MSFDLWGFSSTPFFSAPAGLFGAVCLGVAVLLGVGALYFSLGGFLRLKAVQWLAFAGLLLAGFALGQLFILRVPADILPPPGLPAEPQRPGFALFALLPAFLAGGWLGVGPALVVGFVTGFSRAAWETYSVFTPFEFMFVAGAAAWAMRQDYRGWPGALLRRPALAGLGVGLAFCLFLFFPYLAYSESASLPAWDYVWSRTVAAIPVFVGQAALAGLLAGLVRQGLPATWPVGKGLQPPPYAASLSRKLLFLLMPLFGLGLLVLFWANITIATDVATRLVVDQMGNAADAASRGIPFFIQTGQNLIVNIASQDELLTADTPTRTALLSTSLRAVPFFRQLTLLDGDLLPLAGYPASPSDLPPLRGEEAQLARLALAGIPQNTTAYPDTLGQPVDLVFAAPINAPGGGPGAVLVGRADLANSPLMQSVASSLVGLAGGLGQGFILDEYGLIIYHPDPTRLLDTFEPEASATRLSTRLTGATAYQDKAPDGTRRLVLYYPVPGHPWTIYVTVPNFVVLTLAAQIATPIVLLLLSVGVIGLLLVLIVAKGVTRPAEALALAAQRISEGQLDQPVPVYSEDEIGRAGLAFERMRQRLRARLDELGMLLRVSQGVASSLNLDDALPPILNGALSATSAAGARIVLVAGSPADELSLHESLSSNGAQAAPPAFIAGPAADIMAPMDRGILQLTRDEGRAAIANLARAKAVLDVSPVAGRLHALIALPLRQENNYYGAFWLAYDQAHTFSESEVNFLTTLASQAAVSVANSRLFEAAEQGRQRLAAILASTPDAVVVTDRNERVLLVNPAAEAAFALAGQAVIGRPVSQVLRDAELVKLFQAGQGQLPKTAGEFQIGAGRTLYASASTIIGADGSALGRVCVLRDVTHFKELDQMKSEFVATVSHDLRAPLTFMRGYATMLPMVGALNEKQKEFGDKIVAGVEQMTVLIDDLLDLGRIEAGVGLAREPVQMTAVINEVVETLTPHALSRGLKLQVELPASLPRLSGDYILLRQALTNLVDNALKYTPSGGEVRLRASTDEVDFLFTVSDTGVGIAPADQAHLFEKFFRVRQRGSTQVKGSGLGLAIVKSIVERHGGKVWLESKLGKGSTFYVTLPLAVPAPRAPMVM